MSYEELTAAAVAVEIMSWKFGAGWVGVGFADPLTLQAVIRKDAIKRKVIPVFTTFSSLYADNYIPPSNGK